MPFSQKCVTSTKQSNLEVAKKEKLNLRERSRFCIGQEDIVHNDCATTHNPKVRRKLVFETKFHARIQSQNIGEIRCSAQSVNAGCFKCKIRCQRKETIGRGAPVRSDGQKEAMTRRSCSCLCSLQGFEGSD